MAHGTSLGALPEATELNLMCSSAIAPSFPIRNSAKALEQARFTASFPGPGDARWLRLVRHNCRRRQAGRGDLGTLDAGVASVRIAGHEALILLVLASAPPGLMATFTASSIGSLKGTSIRSNPFS